jgi:hypothetical protein
VRRVVESRERVPSSSSHDKRSGIAPGGVRVSTLSLIDLAGSERAAEDKERRTARIELCAAGSSCMVTSSDNTEELCRALHDLFLERSSRSHAVVQIVVESRERVPSSSSHDKRSGIAPGGVRDGAQSEQTFVDMSTLCAAFLILSRTFRASQINQTSSSHDKRSGIAPGGVRVSTLSLIDLAGSERAAVNQTQC